MTLPISNKKNARKQGQMDTDSFIFYVKTENFYEDIADDVNKWFDTSNYEVDRRLPERKNKKVIGFMKDKLRRKIMTKFAAPRAKTCSYLMDDDSESKKAKGTKKCVVKRMLKFNDFKNCVVNNKAVLKSQQGFKSEEHNVYTEEVNKIALSTMMIKYYRLMIKLEHVLMEQVLEKHVKQSYEAK